MLSPRIGGWGAEGAGGGGDLTSIVIPHPWKLYHPLLSPSPPIAFFCHDHVYSRN